MVRIAVESHVFDSSLLPPAAAFRLRQGVELRPTRTVEELRSCNARTGGFCARSLKIIQR